MSDENRKINFTGFSLAALFIALGFAAAQVLLALKYFETDVLLYENGAQLPGYFYLAAAAVAAVYLVCGIILNKKHSSEIVKKSRLAAPVNIPRAHMRFCFNRSRCYVSAQNYQS